jgi:hypothetical protein
MAGLSKPACNPWPGEAEGVRPRDLSPRATGRGGVQLADAPPAAAAQARAQADPRARGPELVGERRRLLRRDRRLRQAEPPHGRPRLRARLPARPERARDRASAAPVRVLRRSGLHRLLAARRRLVRVASAGRHRLRCRLHGALHRRAQRARRPRRRLPLRRARPDPRRRALGPRGGQPAALPRGQRRRSRVRPRLGAAPAFLRLGRALHEPGRADPDGGELGGVHPRAVHGEPNGLYYQLSEWPDVSGSPDSRSRIDSRRPIPSAGSRGPEFRPRP